MLRQTRFSPCRQYRYALWREWDMINSSYAMFVGLNPSTADEFSDDPTIRRCVDFAKRWGYGALCMTNLFAFRATEPEQMKIQADPIGAENDANLIALAGDAGVVIASWGVHGSHRQRDDKVKRLLAGKLFCLAISKEGLPRHPLYLPKTCKPQPFA